MGMEENTRKPRLQFSLKTLLILTAIVAALLGWWSYKAEKQRRAVKALEKNGASINYKYNGATLDDSPFLHWRHQASVVWLHKLPTDNDIAAMQALDRLEKVSVFYDDPYELSRLRTALPQCEIEVDPFIYALQLPP